MPLTDAQFIYARSRLAAVWKNQNCAMCGTNSWTLDGFVTLYSTNPQSPHQLSYAPSSYVTATCSVCGHTVFFSAKTLGLTSG